MAYHRRRVSGTICSIQRVEPLSEPKRQDGKQLRLPVSVRLTAEEYDSAHSEEYSRLFQHASNANLHGANILVTVEYRNKFFRPPISIEPCQEVKRVLILG